MASSALLQDRTADGYVFRTRSAAAARSGVDAARALRARGGGLLREHGPELGARGDDQGAARCRRPARPARSFLAPSQALCLAQGTSTSPPSPTSIRSSARSTRIRATSAIAVGGHNIKLGRGGIREIEFFAQTQQLIWGGRDARAARGATPAAALAALARAGRIGEEAARTLTAAYAFLRAVEHRLQMIDDRQTHTLAGGRAGARGVRRASWASRTRRRSRPSWSAGCARSSAIYAELFEEQPDLSGAGNLVFTGTEDDPETLQTLERLGFSDGAAVARRIRGWHHGRYRATRSTRARELLTELMPRLLQTLARTGHPDTAFARFDAFLANLPAGVPVFSHDRRQSRPARSHRRDPGRRAAPGRAAEPQAAAARRRARAGLRRGAAARAGSGQRACRARSARRGDYQEVLDLSRRWVNDRGFQVGVAILRHLHRRRCRRPCAFEHRRCGAERHPRAACCAEFAALHGTLPGPGIAVVALGKLGGREMTVTSDLDLIFLYDEPDPNLASSGPKPLPASHYKGRLSQRLINAYTARPQEGGPLRGRHAPQALRQCRPDRGVAGRIPALSGNGGLDLGAYGADARPRDRRRAELPHADRGGDPAHPHPPARSGATRRRCRRPCAGAWRGIPAPPRSGT